MRWRYGSKGPEVGRARQPLRRIIAVLVLTAFFLPAAIPRAAVVINEINYHPDTDQELEEFIELHNTAGTAVPVGNWRFTNGVTYTIPAGTTIAGNGYLVVARNRNRVVSLYGISNVVGDYAGELSDDGERLTLLDDQGSTVDLVRYNDKWPWPASPDGAGSTLELVNPNDDNNHPRNWRGSTTGSSVDQFQHNAITFTHRHPSNDTGMPFRLSGIPIEVNGARTLQSIVLPANPPSGRIYILGLTLFNGSTYTYIDLTSIMDTDGFSNEGNLADGNLDGGGNSYPAEEMLSTGGYSSCQAPGHSAVKWITPNLADGANNCVLANAQFLSVPAGQYTKAYFLATATNTSTINTFVRLYYADGNLSQPFQVTDWYMGIALPTQNSNRATPGMPNSQAATNTPPFIDPITRTPAAPGSADTVQITAGVQDSHGVANVTLSYAVNEGAPQVVAMADDGTQGDGAAGDGVYGAAIPPQASQSIVAYWIDARDGAGKTERFPYAGEPEPALSYFVYNGEVQTNLPIAWLYYAQAPDAGSDTTVPGTFVDERGRVYYKVQIRNRGAWARSWPKKCWKIYFNKGNEPGGTIGTLNLNSNWNDEILIREHLCYELFRMFNYPASQSRLVQLRINGAFEGVYVEVEQPNNDFLRRAELDPDGSLYKAVDNGVYPPRSNERKLDPTSLYMSVYEKKTREWEDYQDLIDWTWGLDAAPLAQTLPYLRDTTDLWRLTEYLAVNCIISNWDHVGKNHYDFRSSETGKWIQTPWDLDRSLGEYTSPEFRTNQPIDYGRQEVAGPAGMYSYLHDRYLEEPVLAAFYHRMLRRFCNLVFVEDRQHATADRLRTLLGADAQLDYNKWKGGASYDNQWTLWRTTQDYARDRRNFILAGVGPLNHVVINEVMAANVTGPADEYGDRDDWIELYNPTASTVSLGGLYLSDNFSTPTRWRIPDGERIGPYKHTVFWCDLEPGEGPRHTNFRLSSSGEEIGLFDTDARGNLPIDWWTCGPQPPDVSAGRNGDAQWTWNAFPSPTPGGPNASRAVDVSAIRINEWLASNSRYGADERGEYEDWIELYNRSDAPVCIGGLFLTDSRNLQDRWMIPYGAVIPARGFYVFWCDRQTRQGTLHTNYRLDAQGGEIALYSANTSVLLDSVSYGAQQTDVSEGRYPDGTTTVQALTLPTPGAPNWQGASDVRRWREY